MSGQRRALVFAIPAFPGMTVVASNGRQKNKPLTSP